MLIEEELEKVHYAIEPFTEEEVQNSIDKLNTNNSSDEYGISAEHLKNSKKVIAVCSTCTTLSVSVDQFVDKLSVRIFHDLLLKVGSVYSMFHTLLST
jgi:uncharacterized protein Smg (DUF494 family)